MVEIIIAGIILGITLAFMVGPVFFMLIDISLKRGIKEAIIFDLGVLLADIVFIALVILGSSFISIIHNVMWVYLVGGSLIIFLGLYNIISASRKKHCIRENIPLPQQNTSAIMYVVKGFFVNFLNAGVLAYWLTTVVTLRAALQDNPKESSLLMAYFIATVAAYFGADLVKIFAAQKLKKRLTDEVLVKIERVVGFVLIAFGVFLMLRGYLS